jgi:hypothetical protein
MENLLRLNTNLKLFQSNIERHLYASGYAFVGLADFSFEIDDEGTPFGCDKIREENWF